MNIFTLKVVDIKIETADTLTLCFKQPGLKKVKYIAGQYLTLIFRINGRRFIRPYSFSSAPIIDSLIEVTIKRVQNGIVSNYIHDHVKIGDSIEVFSPMGDFVFDDANDEVKSIYLWGVGSGITPLISICKHVLFKREDVIINLIYGNRNEESTIFSNQISLLQKGYPNRFFVRHFHTRLVVSQNNPNLVEGRIDKSRALKIIEEDQNISKSIHYICGPSGLKESVKKALSFFEIDIKNILSEDFELVKDPKDFINIQTQNVELNYKGQKYKVEVVKGKSILEAALDSNIELPYSCQTGNCSTCKAKLVEGDVKMIGLSELRDDLLANEYLLCCTHPLTQNVNIEI